MDLLFEIILITVLLSKGKEQKGYRLLVWIQIVSFFLHYLIGLYVDIKSIKTLLNLLFVSVNLYLIISPWANVKFREIKYKDIGYFVFFRKLLYFILKINFILNLIILVVVFVFIPDIADFKQQGYVELYDQIPYFGLLFRYCAVTQGLGFLALPYSVYYLSINDKIMAIKSFILSASTFISALAFYSRAQIATYILMCVCIFYLVKPALNNSLSYKFESVLKKLVFFALGAFLIVTVVRFSSDKMQYLRDTIRKEAIIRDFTLYSLSDYASMGYVYGIEQLEYHTSKDVLYGARSFQFLKLQLGYFGVINYDPKANQERIEKAYDKKGVTEGNGWSAFHGYTCDMVKDFGYFGTILFSFVYFLYVRRKTIGRCASVEDLCVLTLLLVIPTLSIFYEGISEIITGFIFVIVSRIIYFLVK